MSTRERAGELSESRVPFARWPLPRSRSTTLNTPGTSGLLYRPFHSEGRPKVGETGKSMPMENVSLAHPRAGERPMPMPWSRPMACFASCFASCFARPHHAARGLGSQAVRQPRLRAVVASSVLDAPSRQHGCRGPPSSEGRVGELHAHRDGVRAAASRASPRSRACPPRMRRSRSGRRPVKRGGRNERLDGQGRVSGRKGRR